MSRLFEQHMSKTKSVKLLTVPTCGCSTVESPAQYQLSRAIVQPTKACQSSLTTVSHQGHITLHCTCHDCSWRRVRTHPLQILHNKLWVLWGGFTFQILRQSLSTSCVVASFLQRQHMIMIPSILITVKSTWFHYIFKALINSFFFLFFKKSNEILPIHYNIAHFFVPHKVTAL